MRIIVDQDEVLAQFVQKVLRRWNAINGTTFTRQDIDAWRMENVLGVDKLGRSAEGLIDEWLAEPGFFEDLDPMPGAIEGFDELVKMGHDVIVVTSVPEVAVNSFTGKRRWMRRFFPDFSMKNFIACSRKSLITADMIIDDGPHNIYDWVGARKEGAILFDAPWNQHVGHRENNILVDRALDWHDVLDSVETFQNTW